MSNRTTKGKNRVAKQLSFQEAVLLHNARIVKDLTGPSTYRHTENAVATLEHSSGMWVVMSKPTGKSLRRRMLAMGTLPNTPLSGVLNSNVLAEDDKRLEKRMKQLNEDRSRSRLTPPEMEMNVTILQHGTCYEREARMQLMRDTVRGHRPFSEAESSEFHILSALVSSEKSRWALPSPTKGGK